MKKRKKRNLKCRHDKYNVIRYGRYTIQSETVITYDNNIIALDTSIVILLSAITRAYGIDIVSLAMDTHSVT